MWRVYSSVIMGFGSYDESEQKDGSVEIEDDVESTDSGRHDGEVNFEMDDSDSLLEQYKNLNE